MSYFHPWFHKILAIPILILVAVIPFLILESCLHVFASDYVTTLKTTSWISDDEMMTKTAKNNNYREHLQTCKHARTGIIFHAWARALEFPVHVEFLKFTKVFPQKLLTYLKREVAVHFFGSLLRNVPLFRRNVFLWYIECLCAQKLTR